MLRITSLIFALLVSWSACAQVPLTGAGKGAPGGGGFSGFSISNTDNKTDAVGGSTIAYTVGGSSTGNPPNIGAADPNRIVAVGVGVRTSGTNGVSSVSINGSAASQCAGAAAGNAAANFTDIWYLSVPSGTTATVSITFTAASTVSGIAIFRVIAQSATPTNGQGGNNAATTSLSNVSALSVTSGGGLVGFGFGQSANTMGWSAPTNVVNDAGTGLALTGGRTVTYAHDVIDSGSLTATDTIGSASSMSMSVCSWH